MRLHQISSKSVEFGKFFPTFNIHPNLEILAINFLSQDNRFG
jgi:hypothetical protein